MAIRSPSDARRVRKFVVRGYGGQQIPLPSRMVMAVDLPFRPHGELWFILTCCLAVTQLADGQKNGWPKWAIASTSVDPAPWPTIEQAEAAVRIAARKAACAWWDARFYSRGTWIEIYPPGVTQNHVSIIDEEGVFRRLLSS